MNEFIFFPFLCPVYQFFSNYLWGEARFLNFQLIAKAYICKLQKKWNARKMNRKGIQNISSIFFLLLNLTHVESLCQNVLDVSEWLLSIQVPV